ncbi:hypothetical protein V1477_004079 [Vespula maculifrons]|uniref:Uncharacterized protein n=1 Tax=Vespula maculifrons TaxID=7453 RepID=A0ABD2CQK1_VESMC
MEKKRTEKPKYESRARFFGTERRPAQKPTPMSPTHGTHPRKCTYIDKIFWKKNTAISSAKLASHRFSKQRKSHRVEVAASGDPRTNVTLLYTTTTTNQKIKTTGRSPLPTNSSLQTLKLQPHASPHLGTDLRIAQLSNIESFDHHLSTTGRAFATNAGTQN